MIWLMRLAGMALDVAGISAIGFLVYERMGAALDLPTCAPPSWQNVLAVDSGALTAFAASGLLFLWRPHPATADLSNSHGAKRVAPGKSA